jgi:DNA-nicking Smr family endonuclease
MNRIYSISQDGLMLIWKFIDERSEEFQKHLNFVKNIKPKKNFKYDKIYKKKEKEKTNEENEEGEGEKNNNNMISLDSEEDEKSDDEEEENNNTINENEIKYYSEFEKKY